MAIKRLHYFDHQFLVETDFTDEQKYHLNMRRRLNRLLHTFGIAEGLEVVKSANKTVTVRPGVALDRLGQEMIVETDQVVDLSDATQFPAGATVSITIAYHEQQTDPTTATGVSGDTRFTEQPTINAVTTTPPTDGTVIQLARVTLDASANVPGNINDRFDGGVRQIVGPRGERGLASVDGVSNPGDNVDLVAGAGVVITPDPTNRRITIATSVTQGLVSLDGVSNPGGNIDLLQAQTIVITPDDANNRITIGETHSPRTDNPHVTTAAQVGALPLAGGTLAGNLQVNGNLGIGATAAAVSPPKLFVAGTSPILRIADGNEAAGKVLVSDASGNATWKDSSRYAVSGNLNNASGTATVAPQKLGDYVTFTKASAESTIEVRMNTRASSGTFSGGATGVLFEVRIDDATTSLNNAAAIQSTNTIDFLTVYAVFQSLAAGTHTVSVWIRTNAGASSAVGLDPGGWGGRIIVKETF
jgi:hypothetical protein